MRGFGYCAVSRDPGAEASLPRRALARAGVDGATATRVLTNATASVLASALATLLTQPPDVIRCAARAPRERNGGGAEARPRAGRP